MKGELFYRAISADKASKCYWGEIVFNSEEDMHEVILTVAQTLKLALAKKPNRLPSKMRWSAYA